MNIKKAAFPGSFDPLTYGHLDIILRSYGLFDQLFIAIFNHPEKDYFFSLEDRKCMIREVIDDLNLSSKVFVEGFSELLVRFLDKIGVQVIIRGIRALSDFDFEFKNSRMNQDLNPKIQTFFLLSKPQYEHISSSLVREIFQFQVDVSAYVPRSILKHMQRKSLA